VVYGNRFILQILIEITLLVFIDAHIVVHGSFHRSLFQCKERKSDFFSRMKRENQITYVIKQGKELSASGEHGRPRLFFFLVVTYCDHHIMSSHELMNVDLEKKNQEGSGDTTPAAVYQARHRHVVARRDPLRSVGSDADAARGGDCTGAARRRPGTWNRRPPMDYCPKQVQRILGQ